MVDEVNNKRYIRIDFETDDILPNTYQLIYSESILNFVQSDNYFLGENYLLVLKSHRFYGTLINWNFKLTRMGIESNVVYSNS